ncbi:MAG: acyl carrier protein [Desulfuromonadales bacterium]|nr:acyl carrier protein [Desulfuromonadales bacterium]
MGVLETEIKNLIVESLNLEDIVPEEIETEAPLFGDGLGLDSIDALELGIALRKKFNINLNSDDEETRKHFQSVANLAKFIESQRN